MDRFLVRNAVRGVSAILDEMDYHFFDDDDGRIDIEELKQSKHSWFSECFNVFELIPHIFLNINDQRKIDLKGVSGLKKSFLYFKKHLPIIFNYECDWSLKAFNIWKSRIKKDIQTPFGRLRDFDHFYRYRKECPRKYRTYLLDYRKFYATSETHQRQIVYFWIPYDLAVTFPCTETPNECIGSGESIVFDKRKQSTDPFKVQQKTVLHFSYGKNTQKSKKMIELAKPIFAKHIGSHVMKTHKEDSSYFHGVLRRKENENHNGPMTLPLNISLKEIEYTKKKKGKNDS